MRADESRRELCAEVARLLRAARVGRRRSMSSVADEAGLSQQMVSYVERGLRMPTLDTLLRMSAALGIDLATLLRRAERRVRGRRR